MGTRKYGTFEEERSGAGRRPAVFAISGMGKGSTNFARELGLRPGAADAERLARAVRQVACRTKVRRVILDCNRAPLWFGGARLAPDYRVPLEGLTWCKRRAAWGDAD